MKNKAQLSDMLGLVIIDIKQSRFEMVFTSSCGRVFRMFHGGECCEDVVIEDVSGDLPDLIGKPLLMAEDISSVDMEANLTPNYPPSNGHDEYTSHTWTFYKFATVNGYVTVRWFGCSNGYYSEKVDFEECKEATDNNEACND